MTTKKKTNNKTTANISPNFADDLRLAQTLAAAMPTQHDAIPTGGDLYVIVQARDVDAIREDQFIEVCSGQCWLGGSVDRRRGSYDDPIAYLHGEEVAS